MTKWLWLAMRWWVVVVVVWGLAILPSHTAGEEKVEEPPCGGVIEEDEATRAAIESAGACTGGWSVTTIHASGSPDNRFDLVVLGDGFVDDPTQPTHNLAAYATLTQQHIDEFFDTHPVTEYLDYFNIYRVDVISNDPCIDYPIGGLVCDTALDFSYGDDVTRPERCILGSGSKMIDAARCAPAYDGILGLANAWRHGGCASGVRAHSAAKSSAARPTTVHELGHSIGGLADEYVVYNEPYTGPERWERNVSIQTAAQQTASMTKWYLWLDSPGVGTYEGARYYATDIYRSQNNTIMKTLSTSLFGVVNSEGMILRIYRKVSPVESTDPPDDPAVAYDPATVFSVDLLQPLGNTVEVVQWAVDGTPVVGATGTTFQIPNPGSLSPGVHEVTVTVTDQTTLVRDEEARAADMTDTRTWIVTVAGGCREASHCASEFYYCDKEVGDCDGDGWCRKRPATCPQYLVYDPICGCDGEEYPGPCDAHMAGVNVRALEECPCFFDHDCVAPKFCRKDGCSAFFVGNCLRPPVDCPPPKQAVCGCDGEEYGNECLAHANSVNVNPAGVPGECEPIGSCCTEESCLQVTESECDAECGHFISGQLSCDCSDVPLGACCVGKSCKPNASREWCDCQGGRFLGVGASCDGCN